MTDVSGQRTGREAFRVKSESKDESRELLWELGDGLKRLLDC